MGKLNKIICFYTILLVLSSCSYFSGSRRLLTYKNKKENIKITVWAQSVDYRKYLYVKKKINGKLETTLTFNCDKQWKRANYALSKNIKISTNKEEWWHSITDTIPQIKSFNSVYSEQDYLSPFKFQIISNEERMVLEKSIKKMRDCSDKDSCLLSIQKIIGFVRTK